MTGEFICDTCIHKYCCQFKDDFKQRSKEAHERLKVNRNDALNNIRSNYGFHSGNYYVDVPSCVLYETVGSIVDFGTSGLAELTKAKPPSGEEAECCCIDDSILPIKYRPGLVQPPKE